jgi:SAM-dependent methyltransferase
MSTATTTASSDIMTAPVRAVDAADEGTPDLDAQTGFEEQMIDILNHGALALMLSIGHRTGLLDAMGQLGWTTSEDLAVAADLDERYVREWLGAMTTGRIVDHEAASGTYALPAERAGVLTRDSEENLAVFAQYISVLGAVEDDIVECFRNGGGVDYGAYPRFHEIMEEDSAQTVVAALRDHILPLVPELTDRLERGIRVIDVGCGRGRALLTLGSWFPNSTFVGYDLSEEAVAYARANAARQGLANVVFHAEDAVRLAALEQPGAADLVTTFDAVHDQADPEAVVAGIRRVLGEDGVYLAQDIDGTSSHHGDLDHPIGPLLYTVSCLHCMTVSLARGGAGLGAMWGRDRALALFQAGGFTQIDVHTLEHDVQNAYYVCRP